MLPHCLCPGCWIFGSESTALVCYSSLINAGGSSAGGEVGVVNNGDSRRGLFQSGLVQSSSFLPVTA